MIDTSTHAQTLMGAAREHAEHAFEILLADAPADVELRTAAIHAGASAEFLAKARAWQISPLLVLLHDTREKRISFAKNKGQLSDADLNSVRTLQANEVVEIAAAVVGVNIEILRSGQVLSARNQAAHMAISPTSPSRLADDLAQVLRCLLPETHTVDLSRFPGRESFLVDPDLAARVSELHGVVFEEIRSLVEEAEIRFDRIKSQRPKNGSAAKKFDEAQERKALDHCRERESASDVISDLTECPACHYTASAWFQKYEVLLDDDGLYGVDYDQVLSCGVCSLEFNARQMRAWIERDNPTLISNPEGVDAYSTWLEGEANWHASRALDEEYARGVQMDVLEDDNT